LHRIVCIIWEKKDLKTNDNPEEEIPKATIGFDFKTLKIVEQAQKEHYKPN